jgi:hypothetical protein
MVVQLLSVPIIDTELASYKRSPDTFFGAIKHVSKRLKTAGCFRFFFETYSNGTRETFGIQPNGLISTRCSCKVFHGSVAQIYRWRGFGHNQAVMLANRDTMNPIV